MTVAKKCVFTGMSKNPLSLLIDGYTFGTELMRPSTTPVGYKAPIRDPPAKRACRFCLHPLPETASDQCFPSVLVTRIQCLTNKTLAT